MRLAAQAAFEQFPGILVTPPSIDPNCADWMAGLSHEVAGKVLAVPAQPRPKRRRLGRPRNHCAAWGGWLLLWMVSVNGHAACAT